MILNEFFDHIYCINLARRSDRWRDIQKKFSQLSIKVERLDAVDLQDIDPNIGSPKQRARYACTESHYLAIKDAINKNYNSILILEDDCVFVKGFNDLIETYLSEVPSNWEMIMLGYYMGANFQKETIKNKKVFRIPRNQTKHGGLWASHAYGIKRELYKRILSKKNGAFSEFPHKKDFEGYGCIDFTYYYDFHGIYNCFAVNPPLITQEKKDTDVDIISEDTEYYE